MSRALNKPYKLGYIRVDVFDESSNAFLAGYTNLDTTQVFDANTFLAVPTMDVELATNSGSIDGESHDTLVRLPFVDDTFLDELTDGAPVRNLVMRVREIVRGMKPGELGSTLTWTWGGLGRMVRNRPKRGWVEFAVAPDKTEFETPTGMQCVGQCRNNLFDPPCGRQGSYGPAKNDEQRVALVLATQINQVLTVDDYDVIDSPKTFRRGFVELNGARVLISDWDPMTPNVFYLGRAVPERWVGENVTLVPGCNRSVEACRLQWDNEARMNPLGYAMPDQNPQLFPTP